MHTDLYSKILVEYFKSNADFLIIELDSEWNIVEMNEFTQEKFKNTNGKKFDDLILNFKNVFDNSDSTIFDDKEQLLNVVSDSSLPESYFFSFFKIQENVLAIGKPEIYKKADVQLKLAELNSELNNLNRELFKTNAELKRNIKSKELLLSVISHDLRGPLSTIEYMLELIEENFETYDKERIKVFIEEIHSSFKNTNNLVEDLLQWTRSQFGKLQVFMDEEEIGQLISEVLNLYKEQFSKKNITINYSTQESIYVLADVNMVKAILRNLIANAIKFTNDNGSIDVEVKEIGNKVEISVKDDGIGMTKEQLSKLFRIDSILSTMGTHGEKGTGLGLLLCETYVKSNGGKMSVESKPGAGTKFTFTLNKAEKK